MGAPRNFCCGEKAKKGPPQEEKSSEKAPIRENGPLTSEKNSKKVPYIVKALFFPGGGEHLPLSPSCGSPCCRLLYSVIITL